MGRYLDYMVVPFLGGATHLVPFFFLTHLQQLRGYLALTYLVKNQSTGVDYGTLGTLGWIFEYVTNWLFAGALSADFLRIFNILKKS